MPMADHPSMMGRTPPEYVCRARRRIEAPLVYGVEGNAVPETAEWFLDCALRYGHTIPHVDITGTEWIASP